MIDPIAIQSTPAEETSLVLRVAEHRTGTKCIRGPLEFGPTVRNVSGITSQRDRPANSRGGGLAKNRCYEKKNSVLNLKQMR
jgi:hypothetical protein